MIAGKGDPSVIVQVVPCLNAMAWDVYVVRKVGNDQLSFLTISGLPKDNDGQFLFSWSNPVSQMVAVDKAMVFLKLGYDIYPHFAGAFVEAGLELPSQSFLKGQMEALKDHLKDLRKLIFNSGTKFVTIAHGEEGISFGSDRDSQSSSDPSSGRAE